MFIAATYYIYTRRTTAHRRVARKVRRLFYKRRERALVKLPARKRRGGREVNLNIICIILDRM